MPIAPPSVVGTGLSSYTVQEMLLCLVRRIAAAIPAGPAPMMMAFWILLDFDVGLCS